MFIYQNIMKYKCKIYTRNKVLQYYVPGLWIENDRNWQNKESLTKILRCRDFQRCLRADGRVMS